MRWRSMAPAALLVSGMHASAECTLQALRTEGNRARAGAEIVHFGEADRAIGPTAWQGPLVAGACTFELDIIEQPLMLAPAKLLYVPTYSGSLRTLTLVDLSSCSVRWKSPTFSGRLKIDARELNLGGKRIALDAQCVPVKKK